MTNGHGQYRSPGLLQRQVRPWNLSEFVCGFPEHHGDYMQNYSQIKPGLCPYRVGSLYLDSKPLSRNDPDKCSLEMRNITGNESMVQNGDDIHDCSLSSCHPYNPLSTTGSRVHQTPL